MNMFMKVWMFSYSQHPAKVKGTLKLLKTCFPEWVELEDIKIKTPTEFV